MDSQFARKTASVKGARDRAYVTRRVGTKPTRRVRRADDAPTLGWRARFRLSGPGYRAQKRPILLLRRRRMILE
jgi:hypothetical protein